MNNLRVTATSDAETSQPPTDTDKCIAAEPYESVHRAARYFVSDGEALFGWLHTHPNARGSHGVVICPPLGFEQVHSHRALRVLADDLALSVGPVLRFDWSGTGDSAGDDADPERCQRWMENVESAIRHLQASTGCERVSVVGVRLGALIAAAALSRSRTAVENLLLWAPVWKGKAYVRELKMAERLSDVPRDPADQHDGRIEAGGFVMTAETAADLSRLDLEETLANCRRLRVAERDDREHDGFNTEWLKAQLGTADQVVLPGFAGMMAEPHRGELPGTALGEICEWLACGSTGDSGFNSQNAASVAAEAAATTELFSQDCKEELWKLAGPSMLAGILTHPRSACAGDGAAAHPIVVLLNAGAAYRVGPGRLSVELARRLASLGHLCLRLDASGLGDSPARQNENPQNGYAGAIIDDVGRVLDWLANEMPARPVVLVGLCSGAYAAFQAAAQLPNQNLQRSILINPLTYFWQDGMTLDTTPSGKVIVEQYYLSSAVDWRKWVKLFSGQTTIGMAGAAKLVWNRLFRATNGASPMDDSAGQLEQQFGFGHPKRHDLHGDLAACRTRSHRLTMIFAEGEPGHRLLMVQAKRTARTMQRSGDLRVTFIPRADHTFSRRTARHRLFQAIEQAVLDAGSRVAR